MTRRYTNDLFFNKAVTNTCICGHVQTAHELVKGEFLGILKGYAPDWYRACEEPTGRCGCELYRELCPVCKHSSEDHYGEPDEDGVATAKPCVRTLALDAGNVCLCDYYATNKYIGGS